MALQPKIITCGKTQAMISMVIKFLVGPIVMLATSKAMGINGVLLKVAIVQVKQNSLLISSKLIRLNNNYYYYYYIFKFYSIFMPISLCNFVGISSRGYCSFCFCQRI